MLWACSDDLNDLYMYDIASRSWSNLSCGFGSGQPPGRRNGHGLAALMDRLYVFGGYDDQGAVNLSSSFFPSACTILPGFLRPQRVRQSRPASQKPAQKRRFWCLEANL